jgi:hypothetical protein
LKERLRGYLNPEHLKRYLLRSRSLICKSLLKYGYLNFSLEIIEYCEPNLLIEREQYYMDLLKPEYNICKVAGSTLGKKHTKETIEKMKLSSNSVIFITNVKDSSKIEYYYAYEAAKHLNVCVRTLYNYTNTGKLLKGIYLINRVYKK